jgi:hypothetical protein
MMVRREMAVLTRARVLWVAGNVAAAVLMPLIMAAWIARMVSTGEGSLPEGFAPSTLVLAFTLAWLVFLLFLNVAFVLFWWLKGE